MIQLLNNVSNWRFLLPLMITTFAFSFVVFPYYQARLTALSDGEFRPLDTQFLYTSQEVRNGFEALGEEGRGVYRMVVGQLDMIYPVFYGLFLVLLLANVVKKIAPPGSSRVLIALLPLLGVLLDYLENMNTLRLLSDFPAVDDGRVQWGAMMTRMKHIVGMTSVGTIIVLTILLVVQRWRSQQPAR